MGHSLGHFTRYVHSQGCDTFGPKHIWSPDIWYPTIGPQLIGSSGQTVPNQFSPHGQMVPKNSVPLDNWSPTNLVPLDKWLWLLMLATVWILNALKVAPPDFGWSVSHISTRVGVGHMPITLLLPTPSPWIFISTYGPENEKSYKSMPL